MGARKIRAEAAEQQTDLTPQQERFVESLGLLYERQGVPRIGGRMLGLFLISESPLSAERIADILKVSRASVSTNMRIFSSTGICDNVPVAGDRRHYYVMRDDAFVRHMESGIANVRKLADLCREGLSTVQSGRSAVRRRLQEAFAYCDFIETEIAATARRWHSGRAR
jgi:DNA-binding transcriptional regulator GbsR (MarR family)